MNVRWWGRVFDFAVPLVAAGLALALGAVMLLLLGANPLEGSAALFRGAFGSTNALADTAVRATPLLYRRRRTDDYGRAGRNRLRSGPAERAGLVRRSARARRWGS